ncbi:unnamed protein product [Cunninghamella blakesleeana]
MVQTTLFNYFTFTCNTNSVKSTKHKVHFIKQTNLYDYFKVIPKKKNTLLDYFKSKDKVQIQEKEPLFELVLVDIKNTNVVSHIHCVKKNMYERNLEYIAISYRWGELNEQLLKTPDYTAQITSFRLFHLIQLCKYIKNEPDLKEIPYLWVDAISVDQKHHARKKETILKMNQVYKRATYILAIPDLHRYYLMKNTANKNIMDLISKYKNVIYDSLSIINNHYHSSSSSSSITTTSIITNENENKIKEKEEINYEELMKVYQFLAYLIEDWSNRAWVISEYHIAKKKQKVDGKPLKYMFISLLSAIDASDNKRFFSYFFKDEDDNDQQVRQEQEKLFKKNNELKYIDVDDHASFIQFLKTRLTQRSHLDMILNSSATRNEDRFNAILPSWDRYHYLIKNRNTISEWSISDMTSVRLKLYDFIDDNNNIDGLWDKATLLYACLQTNLHAVILPSFASYYDVKFLKLIEKDNLKEAQRKYKKSLLSFIKYKNDKYNVEKSIYNYRTRSKVIYTENITSIRLNDPHHQQRHSLSVKSNIYFIYELEKYYLDQNILSCFSTLEKKKRKKNNSNDNGIYDLYFVLIPFFSFKIPNYKHIPPIYGTCISLLDIDR